MAILLGLFWLFGDPLSTRLTFQTLGLAAATAAVTLPPAILTALLLFRTKLWGNAGLRTLLVVWLFLPVYVHIAGWRDLFGPQGWLAISNPLLPGENLVDGWTGAVWLHSISVFPWVTFLVGIALKRGPTILEEVAWLEVSSFTVLRRVTVARNLDAVAVALVWIVLSVFGEMSIASVCNVRTYAEVVFTGIPLGLTADGAGLTMGPGMLLMAGLVLMASWLARHVSPGEADAEQRPPLPFPLGRFQKSCSTAIWLLFLLLLGPAVVGLVYKVGVTVTQMEGEFVRGWSLAKGLWLTLGSIATYRTELTWTFWISLAVSILTVVFALLLSDVTRQGRGGRWTVSLWCAFLFAIPGPVIGLVTAWVLNQPFLYGLAPTLDRTILAPTLAILTITLPIVTFYFWHCFVLERPVREAAALDGSSWWRTQCYLVIPANLRTIGAGALIAFVLAANDIGASVLVLPAGIDTIARRIFGLLHFGGEDDVAGILLMNLLVVAVIAIVIRRLTGARGRNGYRDRVP